MWCEISKSIHVTVWGMHISWLQNRWEKKIYIFYKRSRFLKLRSFRILCSLTLFPVPLKFHIAGIHTYELDLSHRSKSTDEYRMIVIGNNSNINCTRSIRKREWKDFFPVFFKDHSHKIPTLFQLSNLLIND